MCYTWFIDALMLPGNTPEPHIFSFYSGLIGMEGLIARIFVASPLCPFWRSA
jgi:hypothetical protein